MILAKSQKIFLGVAVVLFCVAGIWFWQVTPRLTKLPSNFSYSADVLSLDNFYDEAKGEYAGQQRSVTTFSYDVTAKEKDVLTIKNVFDVRTVSGDKIFAVERLYGIDSNTGKHMAGFGDHDRDGYLFAPRNLKKGGPFTYWHINYDGPAHMRFTGEEKILGLPVYHYETNYEGVKIDQTENLGFLPSVGMTRGVLLEPYLQLWIEPSTGHLVKYQDDTIAYYYDLKTGKKLNPWNHFTNKYTKNSIANHVALAKSEKFSAFLVENGIPLFFVLVALSFFVVMWRRKMGFTVLTVGIVILGVFVVIYANVPAQEEMVTVGIARWVDNPLQNQNAEAFKKALANAGYIDGKNIRYLEPAASNADPTIHRQSIEHFVQEHVDLIYSLTTPGTLVAKEITNTIPIVFSIVSYPVETEVIKSFQNSGNNLVGTSNWVSAEKQIALIRELVPTVRSIGFVYRKDEPNAVIQFQEFKKVLAPLGITAVSIDPATLTEIRPMLQRTRGQIDVLYSACDTLIQGQQGEDIVIAHAKEVRLPDFACIESGVRKGSLAGSVADFFELGQLSGEKASLILDGVTPEALETTTVSRPFLYINKKTADALGITIPQKLLIEAKEIIFQ